MTLALAAALIAATLPPAPAPLKLDDAQLDVQVQKAHELPFPQRIDALSKLFLGVPYGEGPLGDGSGVEPGPRWNTSAVDCQTYVETVLALANARNVGEAHNILDDIRYSGEPSFGNRNHFTEAQWLPANLKKGYLTEETSRIDAKAPTETLSLQKSEWSKVPALKRLVPANIPDGDYSVRYLPLAEARAKMKSFEAGSVVMVVREADPSRVVRISHMGFVVPAAGGGLAVRHASTGSEHKVINEPLADFIERQTTYKKWPVAGLALAKPVDASKRVATLGKN
ncbi:MAG TPA: N-acetylmuramoyl-L-alanine amidase-like domain-containing protein [Myxococcales bacterium]|jgi:hypothetical protein|nr:N-acetylmuramoyl-L-alanine amidase-like domain-containing protein [Myxococcales bacterium]